MTDGAADETEAITKIIQTKKTSEANGIELNREAQNEQKAVQNEADEPDGMKVEEARPMSDGKNTEKQWLLL